MKYSVNLNVHKWMRTEMEHPSDGLLLYRFNME